jgi:hypothetical protein
MTIRKRDDAAGPKKGELGKYIEPSGVVRGDGWGDTSDIGTNPKGTGAYQNEDASFLRQKAPYEAGEESRDVFADVENQSGDDGARPVRSKGQP